MAEHGEVQYATAEGNDLPAHEAGYKEFVQVTFIATLLVANIERTREADATIESLIDAPATKPALKVA